MRAQRDAFIDAIYWHAKKDRDIVFLSADFGAPSLDRFREDLPSQFVHMGISEQNMIDTAIGLSLRGKKVIAYAMAPFISMRAAEQHKLAAMMSSKICVVVAGVGLGYANAGPTHYATEDFALLNAIIGGRVSTVSDSLTAEIVAKEFLETPAFTFVRLDREPGPDLRGDAYDASLGGRFLRRTGNTKLLAVSQGYASVKAHQWIANYGLEIDHFDLVVSKPLSAVFLEVMCSYRAVIVVDEQVPSSSLGTLIAGAFAHHDASPPACRALSLTDEYMYENIGRAAISEKYGLNLSEFVKSIDLLKGRL